ncbi:MAG: UbiA-like polyprenyltransferase [Acidobacteriota bacterium]|nr:UbiA-like polyprenyltransferase [Acidobacteriota bacterium]
MSGNPLRTYLEMIKVEHTLFALPFAFLGMVMASDGWPAWSTVGWIVVAMVGARSAAMGFNRLVDRNIDATNPRTADRHIPAGLLTPGAVRVFVAASLGLLVLAAWRLNPLALKLSPIAITVVLVYSYTKRFTFLSHVVLGLGISAAPLGAWIAVRGEVAPAAFVLAFVVLCWVAGFDVLYALQDVDFDRVQGLHSIPARFGVVGALWFSATLHALMLAALVGLPLVHSEPLGAGYWAGVAGCVALLFFQHWVVRPNDLSRLNAAFFQANGSLAVWLFAATAVDIVLL